MDELNTSTTDGTTEENTQHTCNAVNIVVLQACHVLLNCLAIGCQLFCGWFVEYNSKSE